jgi:hypothetical protein
MPLVQKGDSKLRLHETPIIESDCNINVCLFS